VRRGDDRGDSLRSNKDRHCTAQRARNRSAPTGCTLGSKIYVGNLPFSASEDELRELFEEHGPVESIAIITDRETGRPRGFGFVQMETSEGATSAIRALDGKPFGGRPLRVSEAQERERGGDRGGDRGPRRDSGAGGRRPRAY
jgi:RNA recognition motif-containing protein